MIKSFPLVTVFFAISGATFAQPAAPGFEVATIKPTAPGAQGRWIRMLSGHEFEAKNHALKTLLAAAYNVSPRAISGGPSWVDADHYDILAKTPGEARPNLNEQMAMLRELLSERFHLSFHREQKDLQIFALTVAKSGSQLKDPAITSDMPPLLFVVMPQLIRLPGRNATMAELASVMQRAALDHPVLDRTGLTGRYDFDLEFTPDETVFGGTLGRGADDAAKPGLFAALQQQLGLRLEATRGPVEMLIIDRVERPSAN
jgi:uncharacterized protein (TIGR03435 family)